MVIVIDVGLASLVSSNDTAIPSGIVQSAYAGQIVEQTIQPQSTKSQGPLAEVVNMVPDNIFAALSSNGNMLQVIVAAILIGVAILLVGKKKQPLYMVVVKSVNAVVVKIIDIGINSQKIG